MDNALKFTPAGGAVTVRLAVVEAAAMFSVEDTGCGARFTVTLPQATGQ